MRTGTVTADNDRTTIPLWPADHAEVGGMAAGTEPTLDLYPAREGAATPGRALVVLPGGGYGMRAEHEGEPVARWANALGMSAAVVQYRVAPNRHPAPLRDAARAVRMVRRDGIGGVPVSHVTLMGFSAGGHLAGTVATLGDDVDLVADGELDAVRAVPDAAVLAYPVITLTGAMRHGGSARNLLGEEATQEELQRWSVERRVRPDTPRTFIWHTIEDTAVPVFNATAMADALVRNGVEVSLNVYPAGRHGLGLVHGAPAAGGWSGLLADWLRGG